MTDVTVYIDTNKCCIVFDEILLYIHTLKNSSISLESIKRHLSNFMQPVS